MKTKIRLFVPLITVVLLAGCAKYFDKDKMILDNWTPDFALPLVDDSITFEKGLEVGGAEKNFIIDESGNISILFYYNADAFGITPSTLLGQISPQLDYSHQFTVQEQQIIQAQDYILPPETVPLNLNEQNPDVRMDRIMIKRGSIHLNCFSDFNNAGSLSITIPEATKGGHVFTFNLLPFKQGQSDQQIDLSGVLINMASNPGQISMQISGIIKKGSSPAAGQATMCSATLRIDTIGLFEGYFGNRVMELGEEYVKINVFNNAFALGTLYFEEPSASVTVVNSLGIPMKVTIEELKSVNLQSNVVYDITNQLGSNSIIDIAAPLITDPNPKKKSVEFTNLNTNNSMNSFINIKPDRVYYKLKAELNPNNTGSNFLRDTSSFKADLKVKFPLYGYFDNLTVQDTFPFNLAEQKDITQMLLRTAITNGLPLMARMQVYFVDDRFNKLDSLTGTDNIFIKEAPVDPATHLPYHGMYGVKDTSFLLDEARIKKLQQAKKMLVKAVMNTSGGGQSPVKIKADQALKLRFSAMIKINHQIDQ
ncbi:MAG: hypothetical protein ACM3N9_04455 [Syntrophothermus sp.]